MSKVCLVVIDGWGLSENKEGNAIEAAETPIMDELSRGKAVSLAAHGRSVGLPDGLMGNSEVGHLNIGAGRVVYQDIMRINLAFETLSIVTNEQLVAAAKRPAKKFHLLGLVSDGGVHAHIDHAKGLLSALKKLGSPPTYLHFFSDGRDTKPTSGVGFVEDMLGYIDNLQFGSLATIVGRYYAMDRDKRHERIQLAYEGLVQGIGDQVSKDKVLQFIRDQYAADVTDEFLKPIIVDQEGRIGDGDTLLFFDFRSDRMRQISEAFGIQQHFETAKVPENLSVVTMTKFKEDFPFPCLFPPSSNEDTLAECLSKHNISQYHCAETEKYAHVTFFFNGGLEKQWSGEHREMVPSPKVATYDLQPTMNAAGVAKAVIVQDVCPIVSIISYFFKHRHLQIVAKSSPLSIPHFLVRLRDPVFMKQGQTRYERIKLAYEGLVQGIGDQVPKDKVLQFIRDQYAADVTDEFLKPIIVDQEGRIGDGDTLLFFDFRSDRMRQISEAFGIQQHFETAKVPENLSVVTMTKYKEDFPFPCLFPPSSNEDTLAECLSKHNISQYHCAETEKYAHVTFFFNGGLEKQWSGEHREMVPSPKVATYDLQPTMNAAGVAKAMVAQIEKGEHQMVMCNFAPPDMVGHTGKYEPTVIACSETDRCIGEIVEACRKFGYVFLITSDHGNAEKMLSETGGPHTAHTCSRVPFYMDGGSASFLTEDVTMALCDVAPTVLKLMGVKQPPAMTGRSLIA
eukprot:sb/3462441/